eukprot:TRINITY_DN50677_c0_g1_i2.p1 TRINITY_DN50677_c0_g1~~TRINITY_DN50677_c0_g1_i2.p1  ORF type:complete len:1260 (+),score=307.78 TRINITY_DN50677_c0_g1_i2:229-4008(+)
MSRRAAAADAASQKHPRLFTFGSGSLGELGTGARDEPKRAEAVAVVFPPDAPADPATGECALDAIALGTDHSLALVGGQPYRWGLALGCHGPGAPTATIRGAPLSARGAAGGLQRQFGLAARSGVVPEPRRLLELDTGAGEGVGAVKATTSSRISAVGSVRAVACGASNSFLLATSGEVYVLGDLRALSGQTGTLRHLWGVPQGGPPSRVAKISAGWRHCLLLTEAGRIFALGDDEHGQCAGVSNGSVSVTLPAGAGTIAGVAAGACHSAAWDANGDAFVWGHSGGGRLGLKSHGHCHRALKVDGLEAQCVRAISCGANFTFFATVPRAPWETGGMQGAAATALWACGGNQYGQLGLGAADRKLYEAPIPAALGLPLRDSSSAALATAAAAPPEEVVALECGAHHVLCLTRRLLISSPPAGGQQGQASRPTAWAWGYAASGQCGRLDASERRCMEQFVATPSKIVDFAPATMLWPVAVAAGRSHSAVLAFEAHDVEEDDSAAAVAPPREAPAAPAAAAPQDGEDDIIASFLGGLSPELLAGGDKFGSPAAESGGRRRENGGGRSRSPAVGTSLLALGVAALLGDDDEAQQQQEAAGNISQLSPICPDSHAVSTMSTSFPDVAALRPSLLFSDSAEHLHPAVAEAEKVQARLSNESHRSAKSRPAPPRLLQPESGGVQRVRAGQARVVRAKARAERPLSARPLSARQQRGGQPPTPWPSPPPSWMQNKPAGLPTGLAAPLAADKAVSASRVAHAAAASEAPPDDLPRFPTMLVPPVVEQRAGSAAPQLTLLELAAEELRQPLGVNTAEVRPAALTHDGIGHRRPSPPRVQQQQQALSAHGVDSPESPELAFGEAGSSDSEPSIDFSTPRSQDTGTARPTVTPGAVRRRQKKGRAAAAASGLRSRSESTSPRAPAAAADQEAAREAAAAAAAAGVKERALEKAPADAATSTLSASGASTQLPAGGDMVALAAEERLAEEAASRLVVEQPLPLQPWLQESRSSGADESSRGDESPSPAASEASPPAAAARPPAAALLGSAEPLPGLQGVSEDAKSKSSSSSSSSEASEEEDAGCSGDEEAIAVGNAAIAAPPPEAATGAAVAAVAKAKAALAARPPSESESSKSSASASSEDDDEEAASPAAAAAAPPRRPSNSAVNTATSPAPPAATMHNASAASHGSGAGASAAAGAASWAAAAAREQLQISKGAPEQGPPAATPAPQAKATAVAAPPPPQQSSRQSESSSASPESSFDSEDENHLLDSL